MTLPVCVHFVWIQCIENKTVAIIGEHHFENIGTWICFFPPLAIICDIVERNSYIFHDLVNGTVCELIVDIIWNSEKRVSWTYMKKRSHATYSGKIVMSHKL